jgi:hypothetical protein
MSSEEKQEIDKPICRKIDRCITSFWKRWKDDTPSNQVIASFTVLITLATIANVFVAGFQWKTLKDGSSQTDAAIAAIGRTATAAEVANCHSRQALRINYIPWLNAFDWHSETVGGIPNVSVVLITFKIKNFSQAPALKVHWECEVKEFNVAPISLQGLAIMPQDTLSCSMRASKGLIAKVELQRISNGYMQYPVNLKISYEDVFHRQRWAAIEYTWKRDPNHEIIFEENKYSLSYSDDDIGDAPCKEPDPAKHGVR